MNYHKQPKMNKKASLEKMSEVIVHLVLILLVLIILFGAIIKIKDNKGHQLRVESMNYALLRDVISTTDEEVNYDYLLKEKIELEINQENCVIQTKFKEDLTRPTSFTCNKNQLRTLQETKDKNLIKIKNE
ncbi:hypothetical protein J4216_06680 [Candidatus Woesearchaeota archaeon]|nr:hypothetical protein [Candidatus Woesearchaeota archaeon]